MPRRILPSAPPAEQHPVRHHHADHSFRVGRRQHVQQKAQVAPRARRDRVIAVESVMRVVGRELVPPVLQAERRIRDHPVVGQQPPAVVQQPRLRDHVPFFQPRRPQSVQQQVQLANGQRAPVALLTFQHQVPRVAVVLLDVLRRVDQHPARPRRRVADAHPFLRFQQFHDQPDHLARGVELAALLARVVRELTNQVLVGVAQHVARRHRPAAAGWRPAGPAR